MHSPVEVLVVFAHAGPLIVVQVLEELLVDFETAPTLRSFCHLALDKCSVVVEGLVLFVSGANFFA